MFRFSIFADISDMGCGNCIQLEVSVWSQISYDRMDNCHVILYSRFSFLACNLDNIRGKYGQKVGFTSKPRVYLEILGLSEGAKMARLFKGKQNNFYLLTCKLIYQQIIT